MSNKSTARTMLMLFWLMNCVACSAAISMEGHMADEDGVYRCASSMVGTPVYRFNTQHVESVVWLGTEQAIEFIDIDTGVRIKLYEDNMHYLCEKEK